MGKSAVAVLYQNFTLHEISNKRYYFCFLAAKHVIAIFNLIHLGSAVLRFEQLNSIFDWYNCVLTIILITDHTQNRNVKVGLGANRQLPFIAFSYTSHPGPVPNLNHRATTLHDRLWCFHHR